MKKKQKEQRKKIDKILRKIWKKEKSEAGKLLEKLAKFLRVLCKKFKGGKNFWSKLSLALQNKNAFFFCTIGLGIFTVGLVTVGSFLFGPKKVERILPGEDLILLFENQENPAPGKIPSKISVKIDQAFSHFFGVDFPRTKSWRTDRFGLAIFKSKENESGFFTAAFFEIFNKKGARNFLTNFALPLGEIKQFEKGSLEVFDFPSRGLQAAFLKDFLFFAPKSADFFSQVAALRKGRGESLADFSDFQKAKAQIVQRPLAKLFLRDESARRLTREHAFALPLFDNLQWGMLALEEVESGLKLSSFFAKKNFDHAWNEQSFQGAVENLTEFLPGGTQFFLQGKSAPATIKAAGKALKDLSLKLKIFFAGRARALLQDFFANEISLENDILPLLADQFVFGFAGQDPFLILQTDDEIFAEQKCEKLLSAFEKNANFFLGEIVEKESQSGERITEIFPEKSVAERSEMEIEGGLLSEISAGEKAIVVGRKGKKVVFSSAIPVVKEILQSFQMPEGRKVNFPQISNLLPVTFSRFDETFGFLPEAFKLLPGESWQEFAENYLDSFKSFSGKVSHAGNFFKVEILCNH